MERRRARTESPGVFIMGRLARSESLGGGAVGARHQRVSADMRSAPSLLVRLAEFESLFTGEPRGAGLERGVLPRRAAGSPRHAPREIRPSPADIRLRRRPAATHL